MYQWSLSELQGVSTQQGALTQRTTQDQASRSSGLLSRGSMRHCLCQRGAPLWAWLLLGVLVLPGAWSFLSEEQEELLVELHNHYRGQVSPSASAMLPLKWDPSLKLLAEGYAAKCIWNHNPELEDTGENLFAGDGPLDLREALEKWFLEHLDYDYQNNSCDEDKMCGHYTQMVWADTHRVGCAFHICNSMEGLDWERVSFLVCNYYPAGNYEEVRPYVEGDWCSRCPENLQKCENNLCVADTVDEEDDGDWWTPPSATSDPPLLPEEEDNGEVVLSPTPTDVQPVVEDNDLTDTLVPDTPSPGEPSTLGEEENVGEEMDKEVEEEKEQEKEEERENEKEKQKEKEKEKEERKDERKETVDKVESGWEKDITRKTHQQPGSSTTGLVSSLFLLVACLAGILTLRL